MRAWFTGSSYLINMPLPPSTNKRMIVAQGRKRLSKEARDYLQTVPLALWSFRHSRGLKPIDKPTEINVWMVLPRRSCDAHNYIKILFDALQKGTIVTNDSLITERYRGIAYDTKEPSVVVEVPC